MNGSINTYNRKMNIIIEQILGCNNVLADCLFRDFRLPARSNNYNTGLKFAILESWEMDSREKRLEEQRNDPQLISGSIRAW